GPALQVGPGENDHEFIPAIARRDVRRAYRIPDLARHGLEDLVARLVAVLIFAFLDPAEIKEEHREALLAPLAPLHLEPQPVPQHPVGGEAREWLHRRGAVRFFC